ncbi:MAG: hypothetical protein E6G42_02280 [Actinobacteria bacterium]|nr:MAG: hypothetical protein E6G42_02280 [Actinomycetota bacterium]
MRAVALCAVLVVLCGCGSAAKQRRPDTLVARNAATGKRATATASANTGLYAEFRIRVAATPKQRVSGGWVISCVGPATMTSRDSRNFSGRTPLSVRTNPASPPAAGSTCTLVATATLTGAGRIAVKLFGSPQ